MTAKVGSLICESMRMAVVPGNELRLLLKVIEDNGRASNEGDQQLGLMSETDVFLRINDEKMVCFSILGFLINLGVLVVNDSVVSYLVRSFISHRAKVLPSVSKQMAK